MVFGPDGPIQDIEEDDDDNEFDDNDSDKEQVTIEKMRENLAHNKHE